MDAHFKIAESTMLYRLNKLDRDLQELIADLQPVLNAVLWAKQKIALLKKLLNRVM